ncbi:histidine kinase [Amycolatopsis mongoliensis]|uniref:histidine kinase n=1 Tax=Amycolatopsis mongoliensis TaxID=715475 RepID=A0A9Y2JN60_9PSEU|nr:histidine kinase [Amycolatopsis sp. 4-36]WIY01610.1 histidine kinase [Amycolatopsis sp. 4-36]
MDIHSATVRSSGRGTAATGDTEQMMRWVTWAVRAAALVGVGVSVFTAHTVSVAVIIAFVVAGSMMVLWAVIENPATERAQFGRLLPYALAAVTVVCGVAAVSPTGGALVFLGFIATISAGSDTSLTAGWTITGLGVLAVEITSLVTQTSGWITIGYPAILLPGLLIGYNRRSYRVQAEQSAVLLAKAEQLRDERARVATLEERSRIAREIHDVLAHSLGALGVQLRAAGAVLTDQRDIDRAVDLLDQAQRLTKDGLAETRRAVHALRTDTPPLPDGLADLGACHERRHHTPVTVRVDGSERSLTADAGLAFVRTAQEALVNAAKYAPRQPIAIHLDYGDGDTTMTVSNTMCDGVGDMDSVNAGYGLAGMRERLMLVRGSLTVGPHAGTWIVNARVPQ